MKYTLALLVFISSTLTNAQEPSAEVLNQIISEFTNNLDPLYGDEISELEVLYTSTISFDDRAEELIYGEDYENPVYSIKYEVTSIQAKNLEKELSRFLLLNLKGFNYEQVSKRSNLATHMYVNPELGITVELSIPRNARGSASNVLIEIYRSED
ncbi:MAG: hypothetical protein F6K19_46495 [Cyanothece sp. SIO1E1]|nr:hypothetical protein [Cyanothece sp. SIO1E1]